MAVTELGNMPTPRNISGSRSQAEVSPVQRRTKLSLGQIFYLPQLIPALLLIIIGAVVIWSASLNIADANLPRHIIGIVLGLGTAWFVRQYDYRALANMQTALFVLDCLLMVSPRIPGLGSSAKGITGWVKIPIVGLTFQPSEVAKLVTIFLISSMGAQFNGKIEALKDYVKLCATLTVPFLLILVQPDLGTGLDRKSVV